MRRGVQDMPSSRLWPGALSRRQQTPFIYCRPSPDNTSSWLGGLLVARPALMRFVDQAAGGWS